MDAGYTGGAWLLDDVDIFGLDHDPGEAVNMNNIMIRIATPDDAQRLLEIYAPYVEHTAISFEIDVPSLEEFRRRIAHTLERYPYLAAIIDGRIIGYAYVSPFVGRAAYDWSVEMSIYVDENVHKQGVGRRLYAALEQILRAMHVLNLNACIGAPKEDVGEDEYLTNNSIEFHDHLGYRMVGRFHDSGYKFGRWYDMVWMERMIGEHPSQPQPILPFAAVRDELVPMIRWDDAIQ